MQVRTSPDGGGQHLVAGRVRPGRHHCRDAITERLPFRPTAFVVDARALASTTNAATLLKGSRSVIASPDGGARVNPTGNPVLATAGSGDVLTGMIGGLLARGADPADAVVAAAYLHGVTGIVAGRESGEGTLAGDLVLRIPEALAAVAGG